MNKEGSFVPIFIVLAVSLAIAYFWDSLPFIKDSVNAVLSPSVGALVMWNLTIGMFIVVAVLSFLTTLIQKYATDQKTLKEMKAEQKILQKQMKEFKDHPEKLMELQKKQFEYMGPMMKLGMRSIIYTGVPFILLFRWFNDFFTELGSPTFLGFMNWLWFYIVFIMIFSTIFRKWLDVA